MSANPVAAAPPITVSPPPATPAPSAPPVVIDGYFRIPAGIGDLESFREWARSEENEESDQRVRLAWLAGTLWVDLTMEQLYTHNQVKAEVGRVLGNLTVESRQGRYIPD